MSTYTKPRGDFVVAHSDPQPAIPPSASPTDRLSFQSAGAVPPRFRRPRPLFENRIREMSAAEIARKIDQLLPTAESGEDWAYICALEAEGVKRRTNGA